MKIFLVDTYKIHIYSLPVKVEDAFLINYKTYTGIEETITLIANNNKWNIESTPDVTITKNNLKVAKEALVSDNVYQVKFSDLNEPIMLYCYDTPVNYYSYEVSNKEIITLGRDSNFDIIYNAPQISSPQLKIYKTNNLWVLEDNGFEQTAIYVNNYRVRKAVLNFGDIIFTNGLKIIWLDNFIKINNPNNSIKTTLQPHKEFSNIDKENSYTPVKDTEKAIVLYNDNQVFFHTPRIKSTIKPVTIKIANPPQKVKNDGPPAILTLGTTVIMGLSSSITGILAIFSLTREEGNISSAISQIIICIAMILGSILFPILLDKYQKRKNKNQEKLRQKKYSQYLDTKRTEIKQEIQKEIEILYQNNLSTEECQNNLINRTNKIWSREITDNDFLTFRVGIGDKKAEIQIDATLEEFSLEDDNLKKEVEQIANEQLVLKDVPITSSLIENKILPLIISYDYQLKQQFIDNILLQLITYYSGNDLKIVILTNKDNEPKWEYIKFLPHCWSDDKKIRFFASNEEEIKQVTSNLEKIYNQRLDSLNNSTDNQNMVQEISSLKDEELYQAFDQYYLIITDNYLTAKRYNVIDKIVKSSNNLGFSILMIEPTMQNIPSKCDKFIEISNNVCGIFGKDLTDENQLNFKPEFFTGIISDYSNILSNIPITSSNLVNTLPTSINFLEMFKVGKIEQLNILNRWTNNDPTLSLNTPIGVHEDGKLFELDLHEKFHGPHGLIAGATGSGKSEFIITFILSMAINYHPYEVQFVLIDYKGGGLAGAFENKETGIKIPHLVGTITNLDTSEMNRTLVSINSELKRRQRMFNEARDALNESTVDIYKYQKFYREGKVKEPIAHLFIISDEFAELKSQQPDFMDELISTARIGRSLGVHLILATQKPSGVVNDQIWSNSRFKVCLKVQTAEDSIELLKRPEAAEIKEIGRFYLQVGFNELFEIGQSAWTGAKYQPTDRILKQIDDSIDFIDNSGNIIKKVKDKVITENQINLGDQLTNIVKTLYSIAIREKIKFNQLWLPNIPKEIYLSNIINKYQYKATSYKINPIIGEYDYPAAQFQNKLEINFTDTGNLLIYGISGSGKENLITTIIYSICLYHNTEEVNFYILDYGAEVLKIFESLPQVGDIGLINDEEKIFGLFSMLNRELIKRKELFSEYGGNYTSYIKNSNNHVPLIITVLNGYESFLDNYARYNDILSRLLRESSKYGIIFIVTALTTNSINSSMQQCFNNKIALQLSDPFDYKMLLNAPNGLIPTKCFGRGIISTNNTTYEFQTAYIYLKDQINDIIKATGQQLSTTNKKAIKIPVIPKVINENTMTPYIDNITNVPIGINILDATINRFDFSKNKINQIIGEYATKETNFIQSLIKILGMIPNIKVKVIDFANTSINTNGIDYHNNEFTATINSIDVAEKNNKFKTINIIIGTGYIQDKVLDQGINKLFSILQNINNYNNNIFILIDNYASLKHITTQTWYTNNINHKTGIWLGKDINIQDSIELNHLTKSDSNEDFEYLGYAVNDGEYNVIKTIGSKGEEML